MQRLGTCTLLVVGAANCAAVNVAIADSADGDANVLQEVIVTAQRREQQIMNVPISVTALSAESLQNMGVTSFQGYAGSVAGLSYTYIGALGYRGTRNYALRGVTGSNTVGFYIDEAPVPIIDPKIVDIERIEVLRGPQATLYGANSVGGTIKLVTIQPNANEFSGHVDSDLSFSTGADRPNSRIAGVVNLPIVEDVFAARMSVSRTENSGFIDNYYDSYPGLVNNSVPPFGLEHHGVERAWNDEFAETARLALRYTPNERLTISPSIMYNSAEIASNDYYFPSLPALSIQHFLRTPERERFVLTNLAASYAFDAVDIVSATTLFRRTYSGGQDITQLFPVAGYRTPTPVLFTTTGGDDIFTQELRAQTRLEGPINATLGAIYTKNDRTGTQSGPVPGLSAYNPTQPALSEDNLFLGSFPSSITERDLYAELRYKILPQLELMAGARYYDIDIESSETSTGLFGGDPTSAQSSEHGVRPSATLSWQASDDLLIFTNYGKGFRPGGTNTPLPAVCVDRGEFSGGGLESDSVTSYDLGFKAKMLDHRMELSVSAYHMKWTDIQQHVTLPCGIGVDTNTGEATSQGVELEGHALVVPRLTLDFSATYSDTNLDTAQPGNFAQVGDPILNIPQWKTSLGAQYEFDVTQRWSGFARVDYQWQDSAYLNYGNRPTRAPFERDAYGTLGLHLGIDDGKWRTELYGSNLTDEQPVTNTYTFATPAGTPLYSTIRPRTLGVNLVYSF
jgi:iron complex outermembrane receptor protein